jgi:hypothetical protein
MTDALSRKDDVSTKSYLMKNSAMQPDNFNAVSQIPKTVKLKIIRDGETLVLTFYKKLKPLDECPSLVRRHLENNA